MGAKEPRSAVESRLRRPMLYPVELRPHEGQSDTTDASDPQGPKLTEDRAAARRWLAGLDLPPGVARLAEAGVQRALALPGRARRRALKALAREAAEAVVASRRRAS